MNWPGKKRKAAYDVSSKAAETRRANGLAPAGQFNRLRFAARYLELLPVFVGDFPLQAELFDARGQHVETWSWS